MVGAGSGNDVNVGGLLCYIRRIWFYWVFEGRACGSAVV